MKLSELIKEEKIRMVLLKGENLVNNRIPIEFKGKTIEYDFIINVAFDSKQFLATLENSPKIVKVKFDCENNLHLKSFEYGPEEVKYGYLYGNNQVTSLSGIGKKYFKTVHESLYLPNAICSNVLGICLIKELKFFAFDIAADGQVMQMHIEELVEVKDILDRHAQGDILECQEELIEAGFKEYAKL
jgi:hypothetical protein